LFDSASTHRRAISRPGIARGQYGWTVAASARVASHDHRDTVHAINDAISAFEAKAATLINPEFCPLPQLGSQRQRNELSEFAVIST
jgi:hypothetical protein